MRFFRSFFCCLTFFCLTFFCVGGIHMAGATQAGDVSDRLDRAIAGEHRSAKNRDRDRYRHPKETLLFFGLPENAKPENAKVLEILPGRGWYTEILAPAMRGHGTLTVASFGKQIDHEYLRDVEQSYMSMLDGNPAVYGEARRTVFRNADGVLPEIADGSQDMVLTFRSTHNWIRFGGVQEEVYQRFYQVLKPGGTLGVVQHRAARDADAKETAQKGYVPEPWLIRMLEGMGFELVGKSEVNANPKDTRDHPEGVWTLPPSLRLGEKDRDRYMAIGESDRMTLKFVKLR